jgi:hypothetical protein
VPGKSRPPKPTKRPKKTTTEAPQKRSEVVSTNPTSPPTSPPYATPRFDESRCSLTHDLLPSLLRIARHIGVAASEGTPCVGDMEVLPAILPYVDMAGGSTIDRCRSSHRTWASYQELGQHLDLVNIERIKASVPSLITTAKCAPSSRAFKLYFDVGSKDYDHSVRWFLSSYPFSHDFHVHAYDAHGQHAASFAEHKNVWFHEELLWNASGYVTQVTYERAPTTVAPTIDPHIRIEKRRVKKARRDLKPYMNDAANPQKVGDAAESDDGDNDVDNDQVDVNEVVIHRDDAPVTENNRPYENPAYDDTNDRIMLLNDRHPFRWFHYHETYGVDVAAILNASAEAELTGGHHSVGAAGAHKWTHEGNVPRDDRTQPLAAPDPEFVTLTAGLRPTATRVKAVNIADALTREAKLEDFVVMKLDGQGDEWMLIDALIEHGVMHYVDELFLVCNNRDINFLWNTPTTAQDCARLVLTLRELGVYVHEWYPN